MFKRHHPVIPLLLSILIPLQLTTGCYSHRTIGTADRPVEYAIINKGQLVRIFVEDAEGKVKVITGRVEEIGEDSMTVDGRTIGFQKIQRVELLDRYGNVIGWIGAAGVVVSVAAIVVAGAVAVLFVWALSQMPSH